MNKIDFLNIMKILGTAYNKDFTEEQVEVWYSMLNEYTVEQLTNAIKELIKTEEYLPTIAHITKAIAKQQTTSFPDAEQEWQDVIKAVRVYGSYREQDALDSLKPYTKKIVGYIGYYNICTATKDEQVWNKKNFIDEYNALKDKVVENLQIGNTDRNLLNG